MSVYGDAGSFVGFGKGCFLPVNINHNALAPPHCAERFSPSWVFYFPLVTKYMLTRLIIYRFFYVNGLNVNKIV